MRNSYIKLEEGNIYVTFNYSYSFMWMNDINKKHTVNDLFVQMD